MIADDDNISRIRNIDWIFTALWSACGNSEIPKCRINIPPTFIFRNGMPIKALRTDTTTGYVERDNLRSSELLTREFGENGLFSESDVELRSLRKRIVHYCKENKYEITTSTIDDYKICTVYYSDGEKEDLTLNAFDTLLRSEVWRLQVLLVVGYVPAVKLQEGLYTDKPKVRSKLVEHGSEATNQLTRALALYAEKSYATLASSSDIAQQSHTDSSTRIVIKEFHSNFAYDAAGKVIFLGTKYLLVSFVGMRKQMEEYMEGEKQVRELTAAKAVAEELRQLMQHAQKRGLSAEQSFQHFDIQKTGFIDVDSLINGLAKLGIGVTQSVALLLIQIIGGIGSSYFNSRELQTFIKNAPDLEIFENDSKSVESSTSSQPHSSYRDRSTRAERKKESKSSGSHLLSQSMTSLNHAPLESLEKQQEAFSKSDSKLKAPFSSDALPLHEEAYRVHAVKESVTSLPNWATKRQKRALKELQRSHESWSSKNQSTNSIVSDNSQAENELKLNDPSTSLTNAPPDGTDRPSSNKSRTGSRGRSRERTSPLRSNKNSITSETSLQLTKELDFSTCADDLLHVDHGVIMSYRVLLGKGSHLHLKTHEENKDLRDRSIMEMREKKLKEFRASQDIAEDLEAAINNSDEADKIHSSGLNRWVSFTLVVVPDIFMTVNTMEMHLARLLDKFPLARIILVGLPGLPNTHWPRGWVLTSDLHASCIAYLLQHLKHSEDPKKWSPVEGEPVFFIGFGSGFYSLTKFLTTKVPQMPWLSPIIRSVICVNGFTRVSKSIKRICQDLRETMLTANAPEMNELVLSLHFWESYLSNEGREVALQQFWQTRSGLVDRNLLSTSDRNQQVGLGYTGILEQLRGLVIGTSDQESETMLFNSKFPLIIVQSTEDVFVSPHIALGTYTAENMMKYGRHMARNNSSLLTPQCVQLNWIRGGHEVIQERSSYLLALISNLAQLCGINPINEIAKDTNDSVENADNVEDIVTLIKSDPDAENESKRDDVVESWQSLTATVMESAAKSDSTISTDVHISINESISQDTDASSTAPSTVRSYAKSSTMGEGNKTTEEIAGHKSRKSEKKEKSGEKRKNVVADRRKREALEAKQMEIEKFQEKQRKYRESKQEAKELVKMAKEDERSLFAEEYIHECQLFEKNSALAKLKAAELAEQRKEEATRMVAENMAKERYARLQERKRQSTLLVKKLEAEELIMEVEEEKGYMAVNKKQADILVLKTYRNLKDLMLCKQKLVESMKRQKVIEQQTLQYRQQKNNIESEIRKLRQAIQIINKNPLLQGLGMSKKESDELRLSLSQKEDTFREFSLLGQSREDQLSSCNRSVVNLKQHYANLDGSLRQNILLLEKSEKTLGSMLRDLRLALENHFINRDLQRNKKKLVEKRIENLGNEIFRVKKHKAELIDSDVLNPGVLQRCVTKELRKYLQHELEKEEDKINEIDTTVKNIYVDVERCTNLQDSVSRDFDRISLALRMINRTFTGLQKHSPVDMLNDLIARQEIVQKIEEKAQEGSSVIGDDENSNSISTQTHLCHKVRKTENGLRSKDDRLFIAMDMQLYPEYYKNLSTTEMEEMKFDPSYRCSLDLTDLQRIYKLPEKVSLAMPFLYTPEEITYHRLINLYYRSKDETFFKKADFYEISDSASVGGGAGGSQSTTRNGLSVLSHMKNAEMTHDIIVKEILRDRLRSKGAGDRITAEERLWLAMDRVLSPEMFCGNDDNFYVKKQEYVKTAKNSKSAMDGTDLLYTVIPKNNSDIPLEGDKYNEIRWRYENDQVIFENDDPVTLCPFSREQLLRLRELSEPELELLSPEELQCRKLMDKYYVHDDESYFGVMRLKTIEDLSEQLIKNDIAANQSQPHVQKYLSRSYDSFSADFNDDVSLLKDDDSTINGGEDSCIKRIYGTFEHIHPACISTESQTSYFDVSSFNPSRDHPACYAIRQTEGDANPFGINLFEDDDETVSIKSLDQNTRLGIGIDQLLTQPGKGKNGQKNKNLSDSQSVGKYVSSYLIMDSVNELARQEQKVVGGKIVLIVSPDTMPLLDVSTMELKARQSRTHRFEIPEKHDCHVLDFTVSIVYQGVFGQKGYKLGRLAAGLFRLPKQKGDKNTGYNVDTVPVPIGYAPYNMQAPNLPDSFGRIVLIHTPQLRPIPPGSYQIVLGAASTTKYTIQVTCHYAKNAFNIVDALYADARKWQARLPVCIRELDDLQEGLRLAERKLNVANKMIAEAEIETRNVQQNIATLNNKLLRDDETMEYTEDERRELIREQGILDIEFAEWAMMYASRSKEVEDTKAGIAMMHRLLRERQAEKTKLKNDLVDARRDIPACFSLLRTFHEASNVAIILNTTAQGKTAAAFAASNQNDSKNIYNRLQTPAEVVRKKFRREGFEALSLEEQQWTMMDRVLQPHQYEWWYEKMEEENQLRIEMGKKPKKQKKYNAAIEAYRMSKLDVQRILDQPFAMLTRKEMNARKLLSKYHDDADFIKRERHEALFGFDPFLAERTRSKQNKLMTRQEKEWATVDKVLHPEVWAYYKNDDEALNFLDSKGKTAFSNPTNARKAAIADNGSIATAETSVEGTVSSGNTDAIDKISKILNTSESSMRVEAKANASMSLTNLVNNEQKKLVKGHGNDHWKCPYTKDELIRIWKFANPAKLKDDNERYAYKLMMKYNGTYAAYKELADAAENRRKNLSKIGSHVKWDSHGLKAEKDVDLRARQVLHELDKANANKNYWMDSLVLHTNNQRFPTEVLRLQLEDALDAILRDQIKEREKVDRMNMRNGNGDSESDSGDSDGSGDFDADEALTASRVAKRAARRQRRQLKLKQDDLKQEVHRARRAILALKNATIDSTQEALLQAELGEGSCLACRTKLCEWMPTVDEAACQARLVELNTEIERVRSDPDTPTFQSAIALSSQLGGGVVYDRDDLLNELINEKREIERRVHLNLVDRELHDICNSRAEYVEVKHLHGYTTVMWANNARKALAARQERLVAMNVANEVVDDILNHMLEGWYFGERESSFSLAGYVPSVRKDGFMKSGQDQIQAISVALEKAKKRMDDKKKGISTFEKMRGDWEEKLMAIEKGSQDRLEDKRVAKEGTVHHHVLNETEQTLKFGLFMLTFMYFRAMTFLGREKRSWGGEDDAVTETDKGNGITMTDERRRMLDEEQKVKARQKKLDAILARAKVGEARRIEREARERKEAVQELQKVVRQQAREKASILLLQRVYRGHLGRKAARRWAMKRAEIIAINVLLNAASVCIQRVWRGYLGRVAAKETRAEMAYFIALMRVQEAETDEAEYWQTHTAERYKRNIRNFFNEQFRQDYAVKMLGNNSAGLTNDDFNKVEDDDM